MNVMFSCYALSCWAQFYILTDSTPGAKTFFFFSKFLIIRGAVYLLKMLQNDVLFGRDVLLGNNSVAHKF